MEIKINAFLLLGLLWGAFALGLVGSALMRGADCYLSERKTCDTRD